VRTSVQMAYPLQHPKIANDITVSPMTMLRAIACKCGFVRYQQWSSRRERGRDRQMQAGGPSARQDSREGCAWVCAKNTSGDSGWRERERERELCAHRVSADGSTVARALTAIRSSSDARRCSS